MTQRPLLGRVEAGDGLAAGLQRVALCSDPSTRRCRGVPATAFTPTDRKYTKEHGWVIGEADESLRIGITDYAQQQLGDIVDVDLPETGKTVSAGDPICVVESIKAASDLYASVLGEVSAMNTELTDEPSVLNDDPYGTWIYKIKWKADSSPELLDASAYGDLIQ